MPDDHPMNTPPPRRHPLNDVRPEQQQPEDVAQPPQQRIKIPGTIEVPYVTYGLLVINVLLFSLRYVAPAWDTWVIEQGVVWTERIIQNRELYRLFTAMFLHGNEAHILFNGIMLYYFGIYLERMFGHVRFLLIYLLGGLPGFILVLFVSPGALGASGALFALMGAELVFLWLHRPIFGVAGQARLQRVSSLIILNFIIGFAANALNTISSVPAAQISNAGHFGGLLGGAIIGYILVPRLQIRRDGLAKAGEPAITLIETNPVRSRIQDLIVYSCGLGVFVLIAIITAGA